MFIFKSISLLKDDLWIIHKIADKGVALLTWHFEFWQLTGFLSDLMLKQFFVMSKKIRFAYDGAMTFLSRFLLKKGMFVVYVIYIPLLSLNQNFLFMCMTHAIDLNLGVFSNVCYIHKQKVLFYVIYITFYVF